MNRKIYLLPLLLLTLTLLWGTHQSVQAAPGIDRAAELSELDTTLMPQLRKAGATDDQIALIRQKYDALLSAYEKGESEAALLTLTNDLNQVQIGKPGSLVTFSTISIFRYCPNGARATFKVDRGYYAAHFLVLGPDHFLGGYSPSNNRLVTHTTPHAGLYLFHSGLANNLRNHTATCR